MKFSVNSTALSMLLLLQLLFYGFSNNLSPAAAAGEKQSASQPAVAIVGQQVLSEAEVKAYLGMRSVNTASPDTFKKILDELVVSELLYQKAIAEGIDQEPEVRLALRQILAQKLIEKYVSKPVQNRKITDAEIRKFYDDHRNQYERPEQIRLADIFIAVPAGCGERERQQLREKAEKILVEALKLKDRFSFSKLTRKYSDQHPQFGFGDTGFFDKQGQPCGLAQELVKAGFSLENGELKSEIVKTEMGFHVIRLIGRREPFKLDVARVSAEIKQKIRRQELADRRADFIASLRKETKVEIDFENLETLRRELQNQNIGQTGSSSERSSTSPPALPSR